MNIYFPMNNRTIICYWLRAFQQAMEAEIRQRESKRPRVMMIMDKLEDLSYIWSTRNLEWANSIIIINISKILPNNMHHFNNAWKPRDYSRTSSHASQSGKSMRTPLNVPKLKSISTNKHSRVNSNSRFLGNTETWTAVEWTLYSWLPGKKAVNTRKRRLQERSETQSNLLNSSERDVWLMELSARWPITLNGASSVTLG